MRVEVIPAVLVDIAVCVVKLCPAAHKTDTAVQREDPLRVLRIHQLPVAVRADRVALLVVRDKGFLADEARAARGAAEAGAAATAASATASAAADTAATAVSATAAAAACAAGQIAVRDLVVVVVTRIQGVVIATNRVEQIVECLLQLCRRSSRAGLLKDCDCVVDARVYARDTVDQRCGLLPLQEEVIGELQCLLNRILEVVSRVVDDLPVVFPIAVDNGALLDRRRVVILPELVSLAAPALPVVFHAGCRIRLVRRRAGRLVVRDRVVLRRIVGVGRRIALSDREAVLRPRCHGVSVVNPGHLVCLRVGQIVLDALFGRELEQTAARIDIRRRQGLRDEVARVRRIFAKQLVVEVIHIFLVELHIGAEGRVGRRGALHQSAVDIALDVGLDLPGCREGIRVICRLDIRRVVLQRRRNRRRHILLVVDNLVAHVRMVHIHEHLIVRCGELVLKTRNRVRIQCHLARVSAANLIRDRRIAVQVAVIVSGQNHIGVRHGEGQRCVAELAVDARNHTGRDSPRLEGLACAVRRRCGQDHCLVLMRLVEVVRVDCIAVDGRDFTLAVRRRDAELRNINLAARIHDDSRAVRKLLQRSDVISAVRSYDDRVRLVRCQAAECDSARRACLPAVRLGLRRRHDIAVLID